VGRPGNRVPNRHGAREEWPLENGRAESFRSARAPAAMGLVACRRLRLSRNLSLKGTILWMLRLHGGHRALAEEVNRNAAQQGHELWRGPHLAGLYIRTGGAKGPVLYVYIIAARRMVPLHFTVTPLSTP